MTKSLVSLAGLSCALALVISGCGEATQDRAASPEADVEASTADAAEEPTEDADGDSSFKDGVLTTPELKIVITDYKVISVGEKGNEYGDKPVIAFWYETTNMSDDDVSPMDFIMYFTAYQDNNPNAENELNVAGLPDDRFLDSQMENIKKGGTVENAMAYELDDETTPVDLVASELFMDEIGTTTYPLD